MLTRWNWCYLCLLLKLHLILHLAPANAPVKLNKTQSAIIKVLLKDNRATYEDLARTIGVDRTTIRRNIAVLKEIGAIRRVGEDKNGYWEVLLDIKIVD